MKIQKQIITEIEPQKKRKNRFSIFINNDFAFGLDRNVLLDNPIHKGDEITAEQIENLLHEEEYAQTRTAAFSLLSYRMRSIKEMRDRLLKKKFSAASILRTIDDLIRLMLLDDTKYSESYIHSRMIQRPIGRRLLYQELKQKGVDENIIQNSIDEQYSEEREAEEARKLAAKRQNQFPDDRLKAKKRLTDFLMRRGFRWDIIRPLLDEFINSEDRTNHYESK